MGRLRFLSPQFLQIRQLVIPLRMPQCIVQEVQKAMVVLKLLPLQSVREGLKRTHPYLLK